MPKTRDFHSTRFYSCKAGEIEVKFLFLLSCQHQILPSICEGKNFEKCILCRILWNITEIPFSRKVFQVTVEILSQGGFHCSLQMILPMVYLIEMDCMADLCM